MRRLLHAAIFFGLCMSSTSLYGQRQGIWDVPCPTALTNKWPEYQPIQFQGYIFDTSWVSDFRPDGVNPVPSRNWYSPVPDPYPQDVTGQVRWYAAHVLIHCQVERNLYGIRLHMHPVDFAGFVQKCGGTARPNDISPYSEAYDPYAPDGSYPPSTGEGDCTVDGEADGPGSPDGDETDDPSGAFPGPTDGGSRSMCPDGAPYYWDIDCIDIYIEGIGWVEYWCGAVMVCG